MIGGTDDKWTPPCFIADNAKRWAEYLECPYEQPVIKGASCAWMCVDVCHQCVSARACVLLVHP